MFTDFLCLGNRSRLEVSTPPYTKAGILEQADCLSFQETVHFPRCHILGCTRTHTLESLVGVRPDSGREKSAALRLRAVRPSITPLPWYQPSYEPHRLNSLHFHLHRWDTEECRLATLRWIFVTQAAGTGGISHRSEKVYQTSTFSERFSLFPGSCTKRNVCRWLGDKDRSPFCVQ